MEEEEEEILCVRTSLRWCSEQGLGTSILRVSWDSRDLSLSFMASSRFGELRLRQTGLYRVVFLVRKKSGEVNLWV